MANDDTKASERFTRIIQLIGEEKFARIQESHVTIVGLGAVGGHAMEALGRAGIGNIRLVDFDNIQPSNINRQILALTTNLGRKKVQEAATRLAAINPQCRTEPLELFAAEESMEKILSPPTEIVIDAIDSLNPKVQLLVSAYQARIPIISSMGAALRTDPSKIRTGDIFDSQSCPLAKHVRKRLRRRNVGRGIHCVYSLEKVEFTYEMGDPEENAPQEADRGRRRNILGSLPTLTGIFGLHIANHVILHLAGD